MTAFAPGTIGIGLYLHDLPAPDAVDRLVRQAVIAERAGFDGATMAEHHAGFSSYLPDPLQAASWILSATESIWSGPNPLLLPLRNVGLVAENLAWLDARFPGRVGASFAPGYHADDFTALDIPGFERRGGTYGSDLQRLTAILSGAGDEPLGRDHAIRWLAGRRIPMVGAAGSKRAATRAADAGIGLLMDSMARPDDLARVVADFEQAGGTGPRVVGRRVWVGDPPVHLFEAQLAAYRAKAEGGSWMQSVTTDALISGTPEAIVAQLTTVAEAAKAAAFALRVHLPGLDPDLADEQIQLVGGVVPALRAVLERTGA
ncbi:MAG: hypothetical protein CL424_02395 [Acidimicrobiaceae bacterium]|nr:hypothetical protein [Acidimicrobiaceae bacterium]